ncbi:hypothetical protein [Pseudochrobactrum sp. MP213Fo]|uniref:hypothetical protein n=1 Tax=Pseudochrobactrum sp. MP213Fo TaxID=3022250 RepID=UPI003BA25049
MAENIFLSHCCKKHKDSCHGLAAFLLSQYMLEMSIIANSEKRLGKMERAAQLPDEAGYDNWHYTDFNRRQKPHRSRALWCAGNAIA